MRLLIAENSENAAHRFDSLLRDAGIATRPEIVDLPMALDAVSRADMMLCNAALPELDRALPRLREKAPHVPIIVVNNDQKSLTATEVLELGAADAVADTEPKHLVLVFKRELENVCQNVHLKQTRRALEEAEQRCQLLLQGSKAAIAYVHEGMHIYANDVYLELFGFEDADDLLGLPLIDLLTPASADTLKSTLKKFRQDEQEAAFDFAGTSTNNREITGSMTLASAEYEGEHCLQVTVRPDGGQAADAARGSASAPAAAAQDVAAAAESDAAIPTLTDSADEQVADDEQRAGVAQKADAEQKADDNDELIDFEFTLDLEEDELEQGTAETAEADSQTAPAEAADKAAAPAEKPAAQTEEAAAPAKVAPAQAENAPAEPEKAAAPPAEAEAQATQHQAPDDEPDSANGSDAEAAQEPAEAKPAKAGNVASSLGEFLDAAEAYVADASENGFAAVFVAQVDNYTGLQQEYGLAGAERVCREVQQTLATAAEGPNMPLSAFQWAVTVVGDDRQAALKAADGYRQLVEEMLLEVRQKTVRPSVTLGGAPLFTEGSDSLSTALEATLDSAFSTMQSIAEGGEGNLVELIQIDSSGVEMDDEASRVLTLINEAIENHKFVLLFQPIISLRGDSDEHYEVFLRMLDRNGDQMAPNEFLRTAIESGMAGKIDRWVILQSIKMLSTHRSKGHNTRLTINVTSNSVADPEFIQWLSVAIKAARLPSDAVIFQITERDAGTYVRQTREFVEALKNMHCRSSLSRFGLSAEPFELLKHVPVDFVKLDGSHIEALAEDPDLKSQVTEMIQRLQGGGKLTIVPMVESANVLSALWQAGANYIQGHYLQEPSSSMDYDFSTDD